VGLGGFSFYLAKMVSITIYQVYLVLGGPKIVLMSITGPKNPAKRIRNTTITYLQYGSAPSTVSDFSRDAGRLFAASGSQSTTTRAYSMLRYGSWLVSIYMPSPFDTKTTINSQSTTSTKMEESTKKSRRTLNEDGVGKDRDRTERRKIGGMNRMILIYWKGRLRGRS
jgi:hypothetical protein